MANNFPDPLDSYISSLTKTLDSYPDLESRLGELLQARAKKRTKSKGDPMDATDFDAASRPMTNGPMTTAENRRTFGGLLEPFEDVERQAIMASDNYFSTVGGMTTPDRDPSMKQKLMAEFLRPKPAKGHKMTEDERQYRHTVGDLLAPEA